MTSEDRKVPVPDRVCPPQVHVTWWDNFSKVYAYQKGDMTRTNFTLCLWTVCGIQRQSLASQEHVSKGGHASKLMAVDDFKVSANGADALPDDILSPTLVNVVRSRWFHRINRTRSFWVGKLRARNVNRVPLKLPEVVGDEDAKSCIHCSEAKCACQLERLSREVGAQDTSDILDLSTSAAIDDHVSGSPDGLLNFFPYELRPHNIGSKIGLARMLAEFNITHGNQGIVKIVNTDVQIFERIVKVSALQASTSKCLTCDSPSCLCLSVR